MACDASDPSAGSTQLNSNTICQDADSDPDGDGWGFENGVSCLVQGDPPPHYTYAVSLTRNGANTILAWDPVDPDDNIVSIAIHRHDGVVTRLSPNETSYTASEPGIYWVQFHNKTSYSPSLTYGIHTNFVEQYYTIRDQAWKFDRNDSNGVIIPWAANDPHTALRLQEKARQHLIASYILENDMSDRDIYNDFTPRRALLSNQDKAEYDAFVTTIENQIESNGNVQSQSARFSIASEIVEGLYPRTDLIQTKVINDLNGNIDVFYDSRSYTGQFSCKHKVFFSNSRAQMKLHASSLWPESFTILHEIGHAVDCHENSGSGNGIGAYMSTANANLLVSARNAMVLIRDQTGDFSGLREYAFTNAKEFFAVATAYFLKNNSRAISVWREDFPGLLHALSNYYGRAVIDTANTDAEPDNCDYTLANINSGWGWDQVNGTSCPPLTVDGDFDDVGGYAP